MKTSIILFPIAALVFIFSNCNSVGPKDTTDDNDFIVQDGTAGSLTMELNDMGNVVTELPEIGSYAPELRSSTDDTIYIDINIVPWQYDSACKGWIREAQARLENGTISRYDTIWFFDESGAELIIPKITALSYYKHVRTVDGNLSNIPFNNYFEMNVNLEKGQKDTVFVFNGNITGNFNGWTFATTKITNVKRKLIC